MNDHDEESNRQAHYAKVMIREALAELASGRAARAATILEQALALIDRREQGATRGALNA